MELEGLTANILKEQLCSFDVCNHRCHQQLYQLQDLQLIALWDA